MKERVSKDRKIRIMAVVLAAAMIFAFVPSGQMSDAASKTAKKKKQLSSVTKQKKSVYEKIDTLDNKITKKKKSIKKINKQVSDMEDKVKITETELKKMQEKVDSQKSALDQRVRAMYKNGSVGYLDIILNSHSVTELVTNVDLVQRIYKADQETLDVLNKQKNQIEAKQATLKSQKAQLETKRTEYKTANAEMVADKKELSAEYKKLQAEENKLMNQLAAIEKAKKVKNSSGGTTKLPTNYKGGKFIWPVHGTVTCEWGTQRSYEKHPGMDIGVASGTPVKAAAAGVVIYAGWNGGYGNCVAISHGSGLITLYGHNSSILVSVGQRVSQGTVIAKSGSTGWSTGPHVHFEVRKGSMNSYVTVNPRNYL
ncbi:MAG: murein hydrolase activator EnvC family protein [Anaerovoracaceae bacterium]